MQTNYIVQPGQNLIDIAMQLYGSAESVFSLCIDNNIDIDNSIVPGQVLIIDSDKIVDKKLVEYYAQKNITLASN
jgi:hypothetical protein